ncbi:MAG: response regulator [Chloroflexota bacterium]|nr:response regulator [Chloroflexota bacterium]
MSTWMIVEDESDIYTLLLAMFDVWGIDGIAFLEGEEAVHWIEDVDSGMFVMEPPELALIDIRLPGDISGVQIGARLRQSARLSQMVIVMITAFRLSAADETAVRVEAGADLLLYKPLPDLPLLRSMLEKALIARRAAHAAALPVDVPPTGNPSRDLNQTRSNGS